MRTKSHCTPIRHVFRPFRKLMRSLIKIVHKMLNKTKKKKNQHFGRVQNARRLKLPPPPRRMSPAAPLFIYNHLKKTHRNLG